MHCTECGSPAATATAKFCGECGTPFAARPATATATGYAPMPIAPPPPTSVPFDASHPPRPGEPVPLDCVWATHPYPGPPPTKLRGTASQRLVKMGALRGRPFREIAAVLGPYSSSSPTGDGMTLLQWQKISAYGESYHYAMIFDPYGVCGGVTHEHVG